MSRTLFWYLFKDLLKIFFLASGVIAGIMSFGGLLRPLTRHGLDAMQVGQMLLYLMPAMTTYSLPIAALFATTIVYGRLSADNELTACRAAGISYLSIATPALVLGLTVAIISLLFLCFIVPVFSYKVEKVIYSNVAKLVAHEIQRTHEFSMGRGKPTIFAQQAFLPEPDPTRPGQQCVVLVAPTFIHYGKLASDPSIRIPKNFSMAKEVTVFINQDRNDQITFEGTLKGGVSFSRQISQRPQVGVEETSFGPISVSSPIRENTKFMDIRQLKELSVAPEQSQRVKKTLAEFIDNEQRAAFINTLIAALNGPSRSCTLQTGTETYILTNGPQPASFHEDYLLLSSQPNTRQIQFLRKRATGQTDLSADSHDIRLSIRPDNEQRHIAVRVTLEDTIIQTHNDSVARPSYPDTFVVPMPDSIRDIETHNQKYYLASQSMPLGPLNTLRRDLIIVSNSIQAEMHSRASFAVSCLILVVMGCALGMMFKSGNFLSAFALSVIPALLCITLVVAGQQSAEEIPYVIDAAFKNPLPLALTLIWSGNLLVLALATVLLTKLQRQ